MQDDFNLQAYNYHLPEERIAQHPADNREDSRLLILDRNSDKTHHRGFSHIINLFSPGDLLVVNDTRVFPARLKGQKETGGKVEVFLLDFPRIDLQQPGSPKTTATATALLKCSKRPRPGAPLFITSDLSCTVVEQLDGGKVILQLYFDPDKELETLLKECGQIPLPPYIQRKNGSTEDDRQRYQTVYANSPGAVAAPTAGLHFSSQMLKQLKKQDITTTSITLHVGYGTFAPVRTDNIREHNIHKEYVTVSEESADIINSTRKRGNAVWAVGTTTVRSLEFAADSQGIVQPVNGWCDLYIMPGFKFKVTDHLITNFHLPCSSLMFLVSAMCGRKTLLNCYQEAIIREYRFFSYGDAMVIL